MLSIKLFGITVGELDSAHLGDTESILLDRVDDPAGLQVSIGLDECQRLLLLGLELCFGELVAVVAHGKFAGVDIDSRADEKILEANARVLAPTQELPPILQVIL